MGSMRMALLLLLGTVAAMAPAESIAQTAASPESQIQRIISAQEVAWNVGDSTSWASAFTPDADFINILGQAFHGRETITQLHARIFAGPYQGSHASVTITQFRQPTPDIVLLEAIHEVTAFKSLPPGVVPSAPGVLKTRMKYVFVKRDDNWQIIAAQNTAILPEPAETTR